MINFILDFLPWIIFSYFVHSFGPQYASMLMIAWIGIVSRQRLKKGFVLDWGSMIFFCLMLASTVALLHLPKLYMNPSLWSNAALTAIMWISLMIKQPFTIQYAKELEPVEVHETFLFKQINQYLTLAWSILMTFSTLVSLAHTLLNWSGLISSVLTTLFLLFGAWMTKVFPDWYVEYYNRKETSSKPND